jgi:hypothetical protein
MTDTHDGTHPRPSFTVELETIERVYELTAPERGPRALAAMCAASPHDPWPLIWFAEALHRTHELAAADRCERTAWALALKALDDRPTATEHLHVLARVSLARGHADAAVPLAAVSALGSSADLALVTLAAALRACRELDGAAAAATEAVRRGSSVGRQILAAAALDAHRYDDAVRELGAVRRADLFRYHGVDPTVEHLASDVPPLIEVPSPPAVGDVLAKVSAAVPVLMRAASGELPALVEAAIATARTTGLAIGTPDFDASAFPEVLA